MDFYMLWLSKVFNVSHAKLTDFIKKVSPQEAYSLTEDELCEFELGPDLICKLLSQKLKDEAKYEYEYCQNENIKIIDITSKDYPYNLINIVDPPPILYIKGTLIPKDEISISIVGSRKYSEYGKLCTKKFAIELAKCGITTISGMAYGIDTFAHSYTLEENGRTIAVLGTGIDVIYPEQNEKLYYNIIENGAVISEFPLKTPPIPQNFPIRNRIVAGMSLGTLVIEANKKSGTMITARLAAEAGRNIYAVPGSIFSQSSIGTNLLIKDGAKIVSSAQDIIEDIYYEISQKLPKSKQLSLFEPLGLSENESIIYKNLSLTPTSIDTLIDNTNLPINEISSILSMLELSGYVKAMPGQQYVIDAKLV